jgi:hypothetical protein
MSMINFVDLGISRWH